MLSCFISIFSKNKPIVNHFMSFSFYMINFIFNISMIQSKNESTSPSVSRLKMISQWQPSLGDTVQASQYGTEMEQSARRYLSADGTWGRHNQGLWIFHACPEGGGRGRAGRCVPTEGGRGRGGREHATSMNIVSFLIPCYRFWIKYTVLSSDGMFKLKNIDG